MNQEKIIKLCDKIIEILMLGVLFLTPLYFNILTYISFEIDKIVLFRIFVEIILFIYLVRIFISGEIKIIKNYYFLLSLFLILLSQGIATIFSGNFYTSFWGSYLRGFGIFTYIHFFVFSYLVFIYFDKSKFKNIFWLISLAGSISSLYALAQAFGFDFLSWQGAVNGCHIRPNSTLGQPNYLASYLLLVLPVTFYLLVVSRNFYKKIILFVFLLVQLLATILTYSRAAWVGFLLSIFIFLFIYIYNKNKKYFLFLLFSIFLGLSMLVYINTTNTSQISPDEKLTIASRFKSMANLNQGSGSSRLFYYSAAIDIIKNNPLVGHGLDSQRSYFYKYYIPEYAIYEKINDYPDRSHNEILDILITTGFLGLMAWVFFFIVFINQGLVWLKNNQDKKERLLALCVFFGLLSLYISVQFGFFTIVSAIYFWFYVAVLFKIFNSEERLIKFQIKKIILGVFLIAFLFFTIFLIWDKNIKINIADYYYRKVKEAIIQYEFNLGFEYFNKVLEYAPKEPYYRAQFAIQILPIISSLNKTEEKVLFLNYLEKVLVDNKKQMTFEQRIYLASVLSERGRIKYNSGIKKENVSEFKEADNIFRELTSEAPGFSFIFYYWGYLDFYQENYAGALSKYYRALTMYPPIDHSDMNLEHRSYVINEMTRVYTAIVDVKIKLEDWVSAEKVAKKSLLLQPFNLSIWDKLNLIYFSSGNWQELRKNLEHMSVLYPDNQNIKEFLKSVENK